MIQAYFCTYGTNSPALFECASYKGLYTNRCAYCLGNYCVPVVPKRTYNLCKGQVKSPVIVRVASYYTTHS